LASSGSGIWILAGYTGFEWALFSGGAALDMISQGESLARIMLRGGWKTESTALKYLRDYAFDNSLT